MNTSQFFCRTIIVSLVLVASPPWLCTVALGQTAVRQPGRPRSTPAERREVEKLLAEARQAMEDGRYETADSLISRAEALQVEFSVLHLGDTPKKARRDLDARRPQAAATKSGGTQKPGEPQKPSQKFSPTPTTPETAAKSNVPNQGQVSAMPPAGATDKTAIPTLERTDKAMTQNGLRRPPGVNPADEPSAEGGGVQPHENGISRLPATEAAETRQRSDALLIDARRALATGDTRRATALVEQAKEMKIVYGFHDDSPAKVEALIRKSTELAEINGNRPATEAARRQRAEFLMEQSEQLLRWRVYDEAERLAADAVALRATFGPFDANPQALRDRIVAERKKQPHGEMGGVGLVAGPEMAAEGAAELLAVPSPAQAKQQALELTRQARAALAEGQIDRAEQFGRQATALKVPGESFGPQEDRPELVIIEVAKARARGQKVVRAAANGNGIEVGQKYPVGPAVYDDLHDTTRNIQATATSAPLEAVEAAADGEMPENESAADGDAALSLYRAGEQALRDRNIERALQLFRQAYALRDQLDAKTAQRLQDHLQLLSASAGGRQAPAKTPLNSATEKQQLAIKQLHHEVVRQQEAARKITEKDPKQALEILEKARQMVEAAGIDSDAKGQMLRLIGLSKDDVDKYILANKPQLELNEENKEVLSAVERRHRARVEIDTKLAKLVDEFNTLMDERRFPEAEVLAKRAQEIDPLNPLVKQLVWQSKFTRRTAASYAVRDEKEQAFVDAMINVDKSAVMPDDTDPYHFPETKQWEDLTNRRGHITRDEGRRRSEREIDIERKLKTPVSLSFKEVPLNDVLHQLAKLAAINLHLDPKGLAEEGILPDTPVNIDLSQEVSLKSALKLILEPLHLSYVIKDEVLKITSEQLRDNEVYTQIYNVADLVIPIPNFAPNSRMGLPGALADAHASLGVGGKTGMNGFSSMAPQAVIANADGSPASGIINNPAILAQMPQLNSGPRTVGGPGGLGGGQQPDFDSLTDLITSTIQPTSWDEVGGPGSIQEFSTNLSLVISQTQEVHEQIVDLLRQLRRLQDLQVTIEVRYITLSDNFFERIGVDFQAQITQKGNVTPASAPSTTMTVGLNPPAAGAGFPNFTSDLAIPFTQSSYTLAVPQFGTPQDVAHFGFAILSDIEAYFLVNASQGDTRSNILQAPKVTLFNGQQASVSDTTQVPFVVSVIPVVGNFAVAQEPVIVVLNEGTFLTVQAVISNDRRFVRLTVVPFFSTIGDVTEFTFSGSSTSTNNTSSSNSATAAGDTTANNAEDDTTTSTGVTVQLPSFSFVTVTTTVSVPDGGTVLLGGIKRLSEGRNEFGVPILSKLPYINRLFTNVGIGRQTQSLMMMVTPRIIIQEEEEQRLGIASP
ncbi:MAG TPA: hypothetical protein VHY91_04660 [Pirellulales bacterium]|nr:hypothetical protein [Pirellulales bacterium]